ncbi:MULTISPECIES: ABC transporter ATP-binding protein [unclassified Curtobacterium]|uniref:ABC transporter ATP-binding protein n=1 Tax=unclassified Curtobacterium TaxID=257496 RepID=UPI00226BB18F|nr:MULTISPECIES: ATP-binding cassette domain-containing protein [unclassified Curtobacterium]
MTETTEIDDAADAAEAAADREAAGDMTDDTVWDDQSVHDAGEDDTGENDADDRPGQDGMTDDDATTDVREPVVLPAVVAPSTKAKPRARRPGRATRPQGSAGAAKPTPDRTTEPTTDAAQADDDSRAEPPVRTGASGPDAGASDAGASDAGRPADGPRDERAPSGVAPHTTKKASGATTKKRAPKQTPTQRVGTSAPQQPVVLRADGLVKRYGQTLAVDAVDLEIRQGSLFGVVGPNGAGKTTTLSMLTGLLRPDAGTATVLDHDVWADPAAAKRSMGVLPDRLRLFDRLTGAQLLYYSATLRGLDGRTARARSADLAEAFGLGDALGRQVADYSVGMAKKIALAATLIHSPRVLVLDEPFESVDPVSSATIVEVLRRYTQGGGTVVLSSHSMELVQRTCDSVAIIVGGKVLASGTMPAVRGRKSLEDKFVELAGGRVVAESMEWLHSFSG